MKNKDDTITALKKEINTLKTIISIMPGHVFWKDTNSNYLGCNNNVATLFKLDSPEEIIGKNDLDLLDEEEAKELRRIDLDILKNKQEIRIEELGKDAAGLPAHYITQKTPFYDSQGIIQGTLGISLDITKRKQIEETLRIAKKKAEAANKAKSKFLAMISHELRTPLTSILGFVSFLEQNNLASSEKKQYIQHIIDSGSYLLSLINNLLDYNKLETNNYQLSPHSFDLKDLMNDVINMQSGTAKLKKINLILDYDLNTPQRIMADSHALRQILVNLIANAIKFTSKGQVILRTHCAESKSGFSTELTISVEDSGMGIPPDKFELIFKRFYQVGDVYQRNKSLTGTGLGLSIVKKLINLMGSKIEVKSQIDVGSTFSFTLNLPTELLKTAALPHILSPKKYNALLIEDDILIQIVHKQMLEELSCEVAVAQCAQEALNVIKKNYDIIFIDIGLPDMSGFELIKIISQKYLATHEVPIIALTGYSEEDDKQQCLLAGAKEVAIKPISKAALGKLLKNYLGD